VIWFAGNELSEIPTVTLKEISPTRETKASQQTSALGPIRSSRYLQLIAGAIFVSVVVSTLIDFQFKAVAKVAYPSKDGLTAFFGSYYAWVSIITLFSQVVLTGKLISSFGLIPSLFLLPVGLFTGSLGILVWPGLFSTTATRMTDAVLRTSVNQSGMEILYLPLSATVKKRVQTFLDVVLQRLADGTAGLIVLFYAVFMMHSEPASLAYFSLGLIILWAMFLFTLRSGYIEALRTGLEAQAITLEKRLIMPTSRPSKQCCKPCEKRTSGLCYSGLTWQKTLIPKSLSRVFLSASCSTLPL
jgi:ATP/ADP translocase